MRTRSSPASALLVTVALTASVLWPTAQAMGEFSDPIDDSGYSWGMTKLAFLELMRAPDQTARTDRGEILVYASDTPAGLVIQQFTMVDDRLYSFSLGMEGSNSSYEAAVKKVTAEFGPASGPVELEPRHIKNLAWRLPKTQLTVALEQGKNSQFLIIAHASIAMMADLQTGAGSSAEDPVVVAEPSKPAVDNRPSGGTPSPGAASDVAGSSEDSDFSPGVLWLLMVGALFALVLLFRGGGKKAGSMGKLTKAQRSEFKTALRLARSGSTNPVDFDLSSATVVREISSLAAQFQSLIPEGHVLDARASERSLRLREMTVPPRVAECVQDFVRAELDWQTPGVRGIGRIGTAIPRLGTIDRAGMFLLGPDRLNALGESISGLILAGYTTYLLGTREEYEVMERDDMPTASLYTLWIPTIYRHPPNSIGGSLDLVVAMGETHFEQFQGVLEATAAKSSELIPIALYYLVAGWHLRTLEMRMSDIARTGSN